MAPLASRAGCLAGVRGGRAGGRPVGARSRQARQRARRRHRRAHRGVRSQRQRLAGRVALQPDLRRPPRQHRPGAVPLRGPRRRRSDRPPAVDPDRHQHVHGPAGARLRAQVRSVRAGRDRGRHHHLAPRARRAGGRRALSRSTRRWTAAVTKRRSPRRTSRGTATCARAGSTRRRRSAPGVKPALRGGDVRGWCTLGWFAINNTYFARPDNTGLALFRYAVHVEISGFDDHLALGLDAIMFTDKLSSNKLRPSELDFTPEIIGRFSRYEVHLAYERDMPVDQGGLDSAVHLPAGRRCRFERRGRDSVRRARARARADRRRARRRARGARAAGDARGRARHRQDQPGRSRGGAGRRARLHGAVGPLLGGGRRARLLAVAGSDRRAGARRWTKRRCCARSATARRCWPRSSPSCARGCPRCPRGRRRPSRKGASACGARSARWCTRRRRRSRRSSCSTICTPRISRRCRCCIFSRASCARCACCCWAATATSRRAWTPPRAICWRASGREGTTLSLARLDRAASARLVQERVGSVGVGRRGARLRSQPGQPAVSRGDAAPVERAGRRGDRGGRGPAAASAT